MCPSVVPPPDDFVFQTTSLAKTWPALVAATKEAIIDAIHSRKAIEQNLIPTRVQVLVSPHLRLGGQLQQSPVSELPDSLRAARVEFHRLVDRLAGRGHHLIQVHLNRKANPVEKLGKSGRLIRITG
jgi:hypothetical protein